MQDRKCTPSGFVDTLLKLWRGKMTAPLEQLMDTCLCQRW